MTFSRHEPRDPADEYTHDRLFRVDRRDNALTVNPRANNYVATVTDGFVGESDQVDDAIRAAGEGVLRQAAPYVTAGYARSALRPASRGAGRDRFR